MQKLRVSKTSFRFLAFCLMAFLVLGLMAGCQPAKETETFKSQLGDFTLEIPTKFEQSGQEDYNGFLMTTFTAETGKQIRIIEEKAPGYTVDEKYMETELTAVEEMQVERTEKLEMETFGTVYGALVEDHSLNQYMFYYKFGVGENVATVLFSQAKPISEIDEQDIKAVISSLKGTK